MNHQMGMMSRRLMNKRMMNRYFYYRRPRNSL